MKSYKVVREIQKYNSNATSAADLYTTTEKGTVKKGLPLDAAKKYLKSLRQRAFQKKRFEEVHDCGCREFRAHTVNEIFIFSIK